VPISGCDKFTGISNNEGDRMNKRSQRRREVALANLKKRLVEYEQAGSEKIELTKKEIASLESKLGGLTRTR